MDSAHEAVNQLYRLAIEKENQAEWKAGFFKFLISIDVIILTLTSAFVSFLAKSSYSWKDNAILTLGCIIFLVKTLSNIFQFEHKAIVSKQISIKLRRLIRTIVSIEGDDNGKITQTLDTLYQEFDDLDMNLFSEKTLGKLSSLDNNQLARGLLRYPYHGPPNIPV